MTPTWSEPRWCVEYGSLRHVPLRVMRTLLMTFLPWKFWSQLQMHHEIAAWRTVLYLLALVVLGYAFFAVSVSVVAWSYVAGYAASPFTTDARAIPAALHALLLPLSSEPFGTYTEPWRNTVRSTASPATFYTSMQNVFQRTWTLLGTAALLQTFATIAFATLPISRRRAKVRWAHIIRVAIYSAGLLLILWCIFVAQHAATYIESLGAAGASALAPSILAIVTMVALLCVVPTCVIWWSLATSRYLKMPHAWGVGVAVVVIGVLVTALGLVMTGRLF